eukprot:8318657-Alexandrium_andersonii.AAC.1
MHTHAENAGARALLYLLEPPRSRHDAVNSLTPDRSGAVWPALGILQRGCTYNPRPQGLTAGAYGEGS